MKKLELKIKMFIARLLDKSNRYCWAELCMWGLGYGKFRERNCSSKNCRLYPEYQQDGYCYCGKFKDGKPNKEIPIKVTNDNEDPF
jgi:hypothetical protein